MSKNTTHSDSGGGMAAMAMRVGGAGMAAGIVAGAVMIGLMIIVMGAQGSGYATPLNLGIPAFAKTVAPPVAMLPKLMGMMGITLPAAVMAKVAPAFASGHLSPAMMHKLATMLAAMHVPAAKLTVMGALMSGHATNSMVTNLLASLGPAARHAVMAAMPVTAGNVVLGAVTHFVLSAALGMAFAMLIIGVGVGQLNLTALRTPAGIIAATIIGGALVYVVNRWLILPAIDPMMRLVPEGWFFVSHLLFGLVVGLGVTLVASREGVLGTAAHAGGHRGAVAAAH